ncbi:type II CAAX prenyl endopeptidase Rce1 family protein [Pseudonocardia sp. WMMC193]|uniref:CPBP family glutamic-type intramembrane protease n=1 Tax=Pseudonocardia sp. WMMC193 TaxID=2911965 RepID=UPI001F00F872|nr:CPBP family glutamic-type intramembrane protease [Pseudonocardia sp. WMMC193]MCF7547449.1 CPBP family glutamic-type intramembrane protease [Pseudonocardia sp. WMMC193]
MNRKALHPTPQQRLEPSHHRIRGLVTRHPFVVFVTLVLGLGWPILSIPALAQYGWIRGGPLPTEPFALAATLLVLLPAALLITLVVEGRAAARSLLGRALRWRFGVGWWAVTVAALPLLAFVAHLLTGFRPVLADLPWMLLSQSFQLVTAVLIINLAEELAWAGFLQTRLEQRHGLVTAAILTALPFALLHLPLLPLAAGPIWQTAAFTIVFAIAVRLLLGLAMRGTGASVLAAAVLHAEINQVNATSATIGLITVTALAAVVAALLAGRRRRHSSQAAQRVGTAHGGPIEPNPTAPAT